MLDENDRMVGSANISQHGVNISLCLRSEFDIHDWAAGLNGFLNVEEEEI